MGATKISLQDHCRPLRRRLEDTYERAHRAGGDQEAQATVLPLVDAVLSVGRRECRAANGDRVAREGAAKDHGSWKA